MDELKVVGDTAFILFNDPNAVETLDLPFDDLKISALNNAQIEGIFEDSDWFKP